MVTSHYEMVSVIEAPDDTAVARAILALSSQGNVTSETCRAFTEEEYRKIVGAMP